MKHRNVHSQRALLVSYVQLVKVPGKTVTGIINAAISGTIAQIEDDTGAYVRLLPGLQINLLRVN